MTMFNARGYHGTSIQDLANALGFSKAALYYYFASKEALLVEVVASIGYRLRDQLTEITAMELRPDEQLRTWLCGHIELVLGAREVFRVYLRDRNALSEEDVAVLHEGERGYFAAIVDMIERGIAEGVLRPVNTRVAAATLIGAANWTIEWAQRGSSATETAETVADVALGGLLPDRQPDRQVSRRKK